MCFSPHKGSLFVKFVFTSTSGSCLPNLCMTPHQGLFLPKLCLTYHQRSPLAEFMFDSQRRGWGSHLPILYLTHQRVDVCQICISLPNRGRHLPNLYLPPYYGSLLAKFMFAFLQRLLFAKFLCSLPQPQIADC